MVLYDLPAVFVQPKFEQLERASRDEGSVQDSMRSDTILYGAVHVQPVSELLRHPGLYVGSEGRQPADDLHGGCWNRCVCGVDSCGVPTV